MIQGANNADMALTALRGVSRECPENTVPAIRAAVCQGYDGVQLDVQVTADAVPVIGREPDVSALCWKEVQALDVGGSFAAKFRGEGMPRLTEVLELTKAADLQICLNMDPVAKGREISVFDRIRDAEKVTLCSSDPEGLLRAGAELPGTKLAYCGAVDTVVLQRLDSLRDRLTVWLPDEPAALSLAAQIRQIAALGIGPVESYDRLKALCDAYAPDAVSSCGKIKPELRRGLLADVHIHSNHSPDGKATVEEILRDAPEKGVGLVCITDHCDIRLDDLEEDLLEKQRQTVTAIRANRQNPHDLQVLVGVELAGGFLRPEVAAKVASGQDYDEIIGSVHGILFHGVRQSTAKFDFANASRSDMLEYLQMHLNAALHNVENLNMDVLGHLTYILRYINGKYQLGLDWRIQEPLIRRILSEIIRRGIALEINTSCRGGFYDEWLPSREIVDLYLDMGGYLFTLGSDAHSSNKIGSYFEEVVDYLRSRGVRYLMYYQNRIPHQYSIG